MKHPDVLELVKISLKKKGFDGLRRDGECGCDLDDLAPCGEITAHCEAGYKVTAPIDSDASFDFYICASRDDRPWETQE